MDRTHEGSTGSCPSWCVVPHGDLAGEDALVHCSGDLLVRETVLRLCAEDDGLGRLAPPLVLLGDEEFTLLEAEALIAALTQLVDQGAAALSP